MVGDAARGARQASSTTFRAKDFPGESQVIDEHCERFRLRFARWLSQHPRGVHGDDNLGAVTERPDRAARGQRLLGFAENGLRGRDVDALTRRRPRPSNLHDPRQRRRSSPRLGVCSRAIA